MIDIWNLRDYYGRIKITTLNAKEHIGTFCCILEKDEDEKFIDDILYLDCEDGTGGMFKCQIKKIETID